MYQSISPGEKAKIAKYASKHGCIAAARKFSTQFPSLEYRAVSMYLRAYRKRCTENGEQIYSMETKV